jgi:ribosome-binding factor A
MSQLRQNRVADQVRDVIAECFSASQMRDPALDGVVVTAVKVTPDLQLASVYVRNYREVRVEEMILGLERSRPFLRRQIAREIKMRKVPALRFFHDVSIERGAHIEKLLEVARPT